MAIPVKDFWRLAVQSRLLTPDQGKVLARKYASVRGSSVDDSQVLGEWLVSENAISRYQLRVLLAGRAGPFNYGDYQVYDRIGEGRLSGMFRASHLVTRHPVLLAFVPPEEAKNLSRWASIASHTQAWSRTAHPNLTRVYEPVDVSTHKMVVLEDIRGQSLESILHAGPRGYTEAALWAQQIAMALAHLHRAKLVHGDVRPATIWLDPSGQIKLLADPRKTPTAPAVNQPDPTGSMLERADYFAPEFASGRKLADVKTDIYALGATLYQMLTGHVPFAGGDVAQKLQRHANEAVQPLNPAIPSAIGQLVNYLLAKNRDVRYQEADHVIEQLRPFAAAAPPTPTPPTTLTPFLQHIKQKQADLAAAEAATQRPVVVNEELSTAIPGGPTAAELGARTRTVTRAKRTDKTAWMIGGACAAVALMAAIVMIATAQRRDKQTADSDPEPSSSVTNVSSQSRAPSVDGADSPGNEGTDNGAAAEQTGEKPSTKGASEAPEILPKDDGQSLWASPTSGEPISLDYVPLSGIAYISSRPASMLRHEEGRLALRALGPHFKSKVERWQQRANIPLSAIDSILITFHDAGDDFPRTSYVVRLTSPQTKSQLVRGWKAASVDDQYYKGSQDAFYIPSTQSDEAVAVFTMGAEVDIKDVAKRNGVPPNIRSGMANLLQVSDRDRHVNVLFTPFDLSNRFFHDGRQMYFGPGAKARQPLEWFLGGELKAVAASMHVNSELTYLEMQFSNSLDAAALDIARRVQARIKEVQSLMEAYMTQITPPQYWKEITYRFPSMFRFVHRQSRVQVDQGLAVVNAALPPVAAHNLLFGCEMALASKPGALVAATGPVKETPQPPKTIDEMLSRPMSLSFDQLSLEFAMAQVQSDAKENYSPEFDFKVTIVGPDLELNGITRNQQVKDFAVTEQPISEILTALVMKANPITTVKTPDELDQKLIWVISNDKSGILITTRDSAAKNNYTLPASFVPKE